MTEGPTTKLPSADERREEALFAPAPCSAILRVPADKTFELKKPCPYCAGKITVRATGWVEEDDGWVATSLDIECDKEPDIDSDEWPEWSAAHGDGDYCEAWHQLHEAAIAALRKRVRFEMHSPNDEAHAAPGAAAGGLARTPIAPGDCVQRMGRPPEESV